VLSVALTAGCATTVGGAPQRRSIDDRAALQELLPTAEEVSTAVGNRLDPAGASLAGSIDVLPNGIRDADGASPLDCLGAVTPLMRVVYEGGGVQGAALRNFARLGAGQTVSSAEAGVVRFGSDAEASRMFTRFVTAWRSCAGTTVTLFVSPASGAGLQLTVTDVRADGPVLRATILSDGGDGAVFPTEHAVGVAADCIVDVDVAITDPDPSRRVATGRAADLVAVMLKSISASR
jgi:hypothetical protein